jgi:hypothetical protein
MVWQRSVYVYKLLGNYTLVRNLTDEIGTVNGAFAGLPVSISGNGSTGEPRLDPLTSGSLPNSSHAAINSSVSALLDPD